PIVFIEGGPLILMEVLNPHDRLELCLIRYVHVEGQSGAGNGTGKVEQQVLRGSDARARQALNGVYSSDWDGRVADRDNRVVIPIRIIGAVPSTRRGEARLKAAFERMLALGPAQRVAVIEQGAGLASSGSATNAGDDVVSEEYLSGEERDAVMVRKGFTRFIADGVGSPNRGRAIVPCFR